MTGLGAFEEHLPYQKYQGPAIVVRFLKYVQLKILVLKQSLKDTHSFAPSFNLRRANPRRANLRRASGDPPSYF